MRWGCIIILQIGDRLALSYSYRYTPSIVNGSISAAALIDLRQLYVAVDTRYPVRTLHFVQHAVVDTPSYPLGLIGSSLSSD